MANEIVVHVKGDAKGAEDALKSLRGQLKDTEKGLGEFGAATGLSRFASLGMLGAVGALGGGMFALGKGFVDAAQDIQRLTAQTGFSAEAISRLRYQASMADADIQELAPSMRLMARSLTDAARGGAEMSSAYQALGLDVQNLRRLAPEQQFNAIMVALAGVTDKTKQLDLAMQIFGRSGASALLLVKDGVDGYRKSGEEAAAAAPKMTAEMIAQAEKIDRAWKSAGFTIEKVKLELGSTLVSLPDAIGEAFGSGMEKFFSEMFLTVEEKAAAAAARINTVLDARGPEAMAARVAAANALALKGAQDAEDAALAGRRAITETARVEIEQTFAAARLAQIRGEALEEQKRLWDENTAATKAYTEAVILETKWADMTSQERQLAQMAESRERGLRAIKEGLPILERQLQIQEGLATYARLEAEGLARKNSELARIAAATAVGASQERAAGELAGRPARLAVIAARQAAQLEAGHAEESIQEAEQRIAAWEAGRVKVIVNIDGDGLLRGIGKSVASAASMPAD